MKYALSLVVCVLLTFCLSPASLFALTPTGNLVTADLWIAAVINTEEKGAVEAVWQKGGEDKTSRGDTVLWGHFYASPSDVSWGSANNPEVFVKVWFDVSGRVDVNYFHVSVPDIEVYSDYQYDGTVDEQGTTTTSNRYIRQYYEGGQSASEVQTEDGTAPSGYSQTANPSAYTTSGDLDIGAMINTDEKGAIGAVFRQGGQDTTARGDKVVWGHFYANPSDVSWGSSENPELFVKVWFDAGGRIDVNFFHVSVPDIEVYSDFDADSSWKQSGTTIIADRYTRHEYWDSAVSGCVDVSGDWNTEQYYNATSCGEGTWTWYGSGTMVQDGCSGVFTDDDGDSFSGTISGNTVTMSGYWYYEGLRVYESGTLTISSDGQTIEGPTSIEVSSVGCSATTYVEMTR